MAHSLDVDALLRTLCMRAHAPCAETAGLQYADRQDVAQEALVALIRRLAVAADPADIKALAQAFGGVLRNLGRNAMRHFDADPCVQVVDAQVLDAVAAPVADLPPDWCEALTPDERTWVEGFVSVANEKELAKVWGVHPATVSRRRSWLRWRLRPTTDGD